MTNYICTVAREDEIVIRDPFSFLNNNKMSFDPLIALSSLACFSAFYSSPFYTMNVFDKVAFSSTCQVVIKSSQHTRFRVRVLPTSTLVTSPVSRVMRYDTAQKRVVSIVSIFDVRLRLIL
jgi:hypothetical protein